LQPDAERCFLPWWSEMQCCIVHETLAFNDVSRHWANPQISWKKISVEASKA